MKRHIVFTMIICTIIFFGCSKKPSIPEIFKTQLMKFLEEGAKTNAKTSQGVSFIEFREQVANTKAAYDLITATWPSNFSVDSREDFEKALKGWSLALDLWALKVDNSDNPVEPNINGYIRYLDYAGDFLVIKVHSQDFIVESYRGKKYLPFDDNISILLTIAGPSFNSGRDKILQALK